MRAMKATLLKITGIWLAAALFAPALPAQKKEVLQLQRDVQLLMQSHRELQRSVDEKHAILKTLIEQQTDATNRLNTALSALQKSLQDVQASSSARVETMATQVQALADNFEEVKVRLGRMAQQLSDAQAVIQSLDAKVSGGAPVPAPAGTAPMAAPPSAETLYSNALRDFTGGNYSLARQEFEDYLRYYPESDLASNARFYLGEISYAEKKFADSIRDYDIVLDQYPRSFKLADARLKKALALLQLGQKASAQRELREVVRRHPGTEAERRARATLRELDAPSGF